jgi:TRAP-type C4-dicarboxylate transport system permease small subunit
MVLTRWLKVFLQYLAGTMLLAIVLLVLSNVFFRYFLRIGLGWTEEAARFLLIGLTFLAAAAAVKEWGHFQLLIVTKWIPHRFHRLIQGFAVLVVLAMSAILVRYGIDIARLSWFQTSPTMEWSMGYVYLVVPVSGAIMFVFALEHFVNILRGRALPSQGAAHAPQPSHPPTGDADKRPEQWL